MASYKTTAELRTAVTSLQTEASARLEALGKLTARARMNLLFDEGTFVEVGTYIGRKKTELDCEDDDSLEPVVTGYGAINGTLVFAFSQDYARLFGALGEMHAKKICKIYEMAVKAGAPIIGIFDSAGAKILEGVDALAGYGEVMAAASVSEIPQIAVVSGPCTGAASVIASLMDIVIIAKKTGELRFAASEALTDKTLGTADRLFEDGMVALTAEDDASAIALSRRVIEYLGSVFPSSDDANRTVDIASLIDTPDYDIHFVIDTVADNGSFLELWKDHAGMLVCGFASMNSRTVGIIANNPAVKGGKLCACSSEKAARFVSLCDLIGLPVITLVDSEGIPSCDHAESKKLICKLADLTRAYATCETPKITVVLGRAFGSLYSVFGSKALGADVTLALDSAKIAAMNPDSAVAFLEEVKDESKHKECAEEWARKAGSPLQAAKSGHIDDIIASEELRQRICASLEMLTF